MTERIYKTPSIDISLKLTDNASIEEQMKSLSCMRSIRELVQLFPDQQNELSRLFVARVGARAVKSVIERLCQNPSIKYAEKVEPRFSAQPLY